MPHILRRWISVHIDTVFYLRNVMTTKPQITNTYVLYVDFEKGEITSKCVFFPHLCILRGRCQLACFR